VAEVAAGIYCRISIAGIGDTTKTDDQERISRDLADRLGWPVVKTYTDHARSAWQRNRKRPGWDDMLGDIEAGRITAVIVYHGDRLIRQPFDLEKLLGLADGKGIKLAAPTGTRDLDSAEDRFILRIEAAMACRESDNTSRRRKSQYERWRREGKVRPGGRGGRAYGFDTRGNVVEAEAVLIRHAARMILDGHGVGDVGRWLTSQGAVTPAGNADWGHGTVRQMLARPRYAGRMPDGASPAAWPAILDRADWETVCAILDARAAGFGYATNARRHLLSGIAACGIEGCGGPMQIWQSKGRGSGVYQIGYRCSRCRKLFRSQPLLDRYVSRMVWERLNDERNPAGRVPEHPGLAAQFRALTDARADLAERVADPDQPHLTLLLRRLDAVDTQITRLRAASRNTARSRLLATYQGISWKDFEALPLATRRALIEATFRIVVLPATRHGPGFNPDDVRMVPA
jgi:site-specific DNA recombinase